MTETFHLERILGVCESDASDKTKVRRIYRMAAQAIAASGIEARSDATTQIGAAEGESPTRQGDAQ